MCSLDILILVSEKAKADFSISGISLRQPIINIY